MKKIRIHSLVSLGLLALLTGCSHSPISKDLRQEAIDVSFSKVQQNPDAYLGDVVIWGGTIIKTVNLQSGTDIYILQTPLGGEEKPKNKKKTAGRFILRSAKFLDPAIYRSGRAITAAGKITGIEKLPIGEEQYAYPVLLALQLHLWRPPYPPYAYSSWEYGTYPHSPYMWPGGGGVGGGWEESNQELFEQPGDAD